MKKNKKKFGSFYSMSPDNGDHGIWKFGNPGGPISIGKFNNATGDATGAGTSGTGGTSACATSGMGEALLETYLNRLLLEEARRYIAQCCRIPAASVLIYPNGRFHIYNIPETDAHHIKNYLMQDNKISDVFLSAGSYDFSHFNHTMLPTLKLNISGLFTESLLDEGVGDALSVLGDRVKGSLKKTHDNLKIEDIVARTLIKNYFKRNPLVYIFDSTSTYSSSKLEDWILKCSSKNVHIYNGLYEIFKNGSDDLNNNLKLMLGRCLSLVKSGFLVFDKNADDKKGKYVPTQIKDFDQFKNLYESFVKNNIDKPVNDILKGFCNNPTTISPNYVIALYFYLTAYPGKDKSLGAINLQVKVIVDKYIKDNPSIQRNIELILDTQLQNNIRKNTNPNLTNKQAGELSNNITLDLKYHKFFVCIVSSSEYAELQQTQPDLLKKCNIVNLVYDLDLNGNNVEDIEDLSEDEADSTDEQSVNIATTVQSSLKGHLLNHSEYAHRSGGKALDIGSGVRGKGHKNNLFASLITTNSNAILTEADNIEQFYMNPDVEIDEYKLDPDDFDLYDDEGDYEFAHEYNPQIDYALDDLDNQLSWLVADGMCSKPIYSGSLLVVDFDPVPEVKLAVLNIINLVCKGINADIEEDGYSVVITFK